MFPPIYTLSLFSQYCKYCKFHRAINFVVDLIVVYFDMDSYHQKVHKYLEYHSVCPLVGIGPPHPLSPKTRGGGYSTRSPACEGVRRPNSDDWRDSLVLCLLCGFHQTLPWLAKSRGVFFQPHGFFGFSLLICRIRMASQKGANNMCNLCKI